MSTFRIHRAGIPARYEIVSGDGPVTTVSAQTAQHGGEIDVNGQTYRLDGSVLGRNCILRTPDRRVIASAERDGLRSWRVAADGREFHLARTGFGSRNLEFVEGGKPIGRIHRVSRGAEAELPGLDRPAEVFVLVVALAMWQRRRRAAVIAR